MVGGSQVSSEVMEVRLGSKRNIAMGSHPIAKSTDGILVLAIHQCEPEKQTETTTMPK
jgi:hypothetical protein